MNEWSGAVGGNPIVTTTATDLRASRIVSNLRKDQIIRQELDMAREYVEKIGAENARLTEERDRARDLAVRLLAEADEAQADAMLAIEGVEAERDQAIYERDSADICPVCRAPRKEQTSACGGVRNGE